MAIVKAIREAMADQIDAALGSAPWDLQVASIMVVNPTPPTIDVYPSDPARDNTTEVGGFAETDADAGDGLWVNVRARISTADSEAGQDVLDEFMSPDSELSIVQAVYDDPTLGGIAADVDLESMTGYVLVPTIDGSGAFIGVIWRFLVIPARS